MSLPAVKYPAQLVSFLVGFLSLGAETLWVRTFSYANQSTPHSLAIVLGLYLIGIALGASIGGDKCKTSGRLVDLSAATILAAAAMLVLTPLVIAVLPASNLVLMPLILLPALLFSISFPICHHLGTQAGSGRMGRSLSRVYAANIAGSVLGPLAVNFGLLEIATTQTAFVLLGAAGLALGAAIAIGNPVEPRLALAAKSGAVIGLIALTASAQAANHLVTRLAKDEDPARHIVETRQGIVATFANDRKGDAVYGSNVYDGRTNVDPRINSNGINRIIMLAALTPKPKRVLVIGLSVGSWQHVLAGFPGVEEMDVVEINPGYIQLARNYDAQRRAIEDPRVRLVIGDGRKFLRQHPDRVYDLVVMNSTWHWRMYATMLLSREFLTMVRAHMTPEAVMTFNTTGSPDVLATAAAVFPHAYLYDNFVVVGQTDWRERMRGPEAFAALKAVRPGGKPMFGAGDDDLIADFLSLARVRDLSTIAAKAGRPLEIITDRNLLTEYRHALR
jgi:spermidine synthase